ncbi:exonuclease RecJ [Haloplanus halobius]|uniref:exonuclease RecJ n=1 Tax=Haloplanus halobius TaxID=2934938 RepID=UPI00200D26A0|nr:exonuclease RecJ [Haloplanus sp. XH21]
MSTAPATETTADAADIATALRNAPFVRVVAAADGDSLAASGVLARALSDCGVPFQIRADPLSDPVPGDDNLVVACGTTGGDVALAGQSTPASLVAADASRALGVDPDPIVALAGVAASGRPIDAGAASTLLDAARERTAVERRPGVAVPTADVADGLAHSTLVHAPLSGDPEAARDALDAVAFPDAPSTEDHRRLASWLAIEATASSARAATAVERALRPHATPDGQFATIEGFGDALDAAASERPGAGVALALRGDDATRDAVLDAWRTHARAVHSALTTATTGRYDGVFVVRTDDGHPGRLGTVARLSLAYRSPEPVVVAVAGDDAVSAAAAASADDDALDEAMRVAVRNVDADGTSAGDTRRATARFDDEVPVSRLITAFREAL